MRNNEFSGKIPADNVQILYVTMSIIILMNLINRLTYKHTNIFKYIHIYTNICTHLCVYACLMKKEKNE